MMVSSGATSSYKFNPSFQTDSEAIDGFVVREMELETILSTVRSNSTASRNQNVLITAPRGAGKTTLVRRVLAEIRTNDDLARSWHPIFLGEESYTVTTPGEFFLECLFHLQDHLQDQDWRKTYEEAEALQDEVALMSAAVSALKRFGQNKKKRLLFIVENVHMIMCEQLAAGADVLRKTLEDAAFMMLATSVRDLSDEKNEQGYITFIDGYEIIHLQPLTLAECQKLWEALTRQEVKQERIRPLQILTGGSPRLLRIMAEFAVTPSLQNLMENLNLLIDQNTEYFKSQLDSLPPIERKVFAALLDIWDPSTAKQVSERARVNVNIASAMLGRLADRGSVVKVPGKGRLVTYHAAERLFNIYYLMRRRSHPSSRVKALVAFMTQYYRGDELIDTTAKLVAEACSLDPMLRQEYHSTFNAIIAQSSWDVRQRILAQTPSDFLLSIRDSSELQSTPDGISSSPKSELQIVYDTSKKKDSSSNSVSSSRSKRAVGAILKKVRSAVENHQYSQAEELLRAAILKNEADEGLWAELISVQNEANKDANEVLNTAAHAVRLFPDSSMAHTTLGVALYRHDGDENEIEEHLSKAIELDPKNILALTTYGDFKHRKRDFDAALHYYQRVWIEARDLEFALCDVVSILGAHLEKYEEAEELLRGALAIHPEWRMARLALADILAAQRRFDDGETILRDGIKRDKKSSKRWADLGRFLFSRRRHYSKARTALERSLELDANNREVWIAYARVLQRLENMADKAIDAAKRAIELKPELSDGWLILGNIYNKIDNASEAEKAFLEAINLESESARNWYEYGVFLKEKTERLHDAETALRRACNASDDYPCMVPNSLAAILIHRGADKDAEPLLKRSIEINNDCYCSLNLLAGISNRTRDLDEAKRYFERALNVDPKGITALTGLAQLAIEDDADLTLAETLIDQAIAVGPKDPRVLLARAFLRRSQRSISECLDDLRNALAINPDFVEAKVVLALVEAQHGDAAQAIAYLTEAMRSLNHRRDLLPTLVDTATALMERGYSASVEQAIYDAKALEYLEPLHVALQILQGKSPVVAKEVQEVAFDILKKISKKTVEDLPASE